MSAEGSGLTSHHQDQVDTYLKFTKKRREEQLKELEETFRSFKDSKLFEDDYTLEDVIKIVESLSVVVKATLQSELIKGAQQNAVLLVDLLSQAEKRSIWLDIDPMTLESGQLHSIVSNMDQKNVLGGPATGAKVLPSLKTSPMEQAAELQRLKDENKVLRDRCASMQQQFSAGMKEKEELKTILASPPPKPEPVPIVTAKHDDSDLRSEISLLRKDLEALRSSLDASQGSNTALEKKLAIATADVDAAKKEASAKVNESKQFQSLQKMLATKTTQIKTLREQLSKYQPIAEDAEN